MHRSPTTTNVSMSRRSSLVLLVLAAALASCVRHPGAAAPGLTVSPNFFTIAQEHFVEDSLPGGIYAVVGNPGGDEGGWFGFADVEHQIPMTDSTLFNIGSVSQPITALLTAILIHKGEVSLFEPVIGMTRGLTPPPGFDSARVNINTILSHTAGLGMSSVPCAPLDSARPSTADALRGTFGDRGPLTIVGRPGERFAYSGGGYTLLQLALETRFQLSFETLLDRELFATLGRFDATTDPHPGQPLAIPYAEDGRALRAYRCVGEAAGGLFLSQRDAYRLLRAYVGDAFGVLSHGDIEFVGAPRVAAAIPGVDVGGASYGYGHFVVGTAAGDTILFHGGGNPGAVAYLAVNRRRHTAIFVAVNAERGISLVKALVAEWARSGGFTPPPVF